MHFLFGITEVFTNREYHEMCLIYEVAYCYVARGRRVFSERYPGRRFPNVETFVADSQRAFNIGRIFPQ